MWSGCLRSVLYVGLMDGICPGALLVNEESNEYEWQQVIWNIPPASARNSVTAHQGNKKNLPL